MSELLKALAARIGASHTRPADRPALRGIVFLSLVAALCISGIISIAVGTEPETTTLKVPAAAAPGSSTPQAAPTVTEESSLRDNALTILGSIAAAAVGGIAGVLTLGRRSEEGEVGEEATAADPPVTKPEPNSTTAAGV